MAIYWFFAFIILLFIELSTVNLVSIWFAIGSLGAMICSLFTDSFIISLLVFALVSLITLLITKPLVKKFKANKMIPTNLDRVIGKRAEVTKKITPDDYGEVKVLGTIWTATSKMTIDIGEKVLVEAIDGVKLVVNKEEK